MRRSRWEEQVGWSECDLDRKYGVQEVLQEDIQDQTTPMVVVGTDVINLYPSLDIKKVVGTVGEAILESKITWDAVDYLEGARYIALNWTEAQCRSSRLRRILPRRRHKGGSRPGLTGEGPLGAERGDQEQWVFPQVRLRWEERRLIIATVVEIATEAMFSHHFYGFGGSKYKQMEGGPIGLRGTCTMARLVMQIYDRKWMNRVVDAGLVVELYTRYMDDGRKLLQPIKRGWRWEDGRLQFCMRWKHEDMDKSLTEVTVGVLKGTVSGITDYLNFTFETGEDYNDGWLPTLDISVRVNERNQIDYRYFEKPTTTNTTVRKESAMSENPKMQSLSNDLVRRLLNTKEELPDKYRADVVDGYGVKLLTSGYSREQCERILIGGMKGYINKVARRKKHGRRIHLTARESMGSRIKKRLLGQSSWYKGRNKGDDVRNGGVRGGRAMKKGEAAPLKTRAVLFVEQSPQGGLARMVKDKLSGLEPSLGFRVRVVERTGRSLVSLLPQPKGGGGEHCGRDHCVTCSQEGEEYPDCTRSNLVYESICTRCNPSGLRKGELKQQESTRPSLYVGETSRSIQERALEHWKGAKKQDPKNHMHKHQCIEHEGEEPAFIFKVVSQHRTALSRQVKEAVRIRRRGGAGSILNSRGEFNRCHIPRLVVEIEDQEKKEKRLLEEAEENEEIQSKMNDEDGSWMARKTRQLEIREKKRRLLSMVEEDYKQEGGKRKPKRLKYEVVKEGWGEEDPSMEDEEQGNQETPTPTAPPSSSSTCDQEERQ